MTSPSEGDTLLEAVNLLQEGWRPDHIRPLEFEAIDHPLRRKTDWMLSPGNEQDSLIKCLRDEISSLKHRSQLLSQQISTSVDEAKIEARRQASEELHLELDARLIEEQVRITDACMLFEKQRVNYFAGVESEVVRLALAIATRVLHREAQLDPLLLFAVVRVALEKLADSSATVLHVPLAQISGWNTLLTQNNLTTVQVIGDEHMEATDCMLQTKVGRVELGIVEQLQEIEKGFFDLLQQRPG